ncbi:NINE protein [Bdellovibrio bacteriovorus]|uniref:NINE protein n=1 Tax=Bdellovibrio bacteriovorus TaxID=959 RepID=UPI0035A6F222
MKNRTTAIVLCLFLGGIGGHRFYLDKPVSGIFYLLFCWTFIPAIFALCELFGFLFQSEERFNAEYNSGKTSSSKSASDELTALANLFEKNLLTKDEYESKKTELLKRIG